mmetsp:Transcript_57322/g.180069  ORF Transcript_57322/g.180069 Transcript_57322/m.180069 type:complete len:107 (-) Transcript_57322:249-569(-)
MRRLIAEACEISAELSPYLTSRSNRTSPTWVPCDRTGTSQRTGGPGCRRIDCPVARSLTYQTAALQPGLADAEVAIAALALAAGRGGDRLRVAIHQPVGRPRRKNS